MSTQEQPQPQSQPQTSEQIQDPKAFKGTLPKCEFAKVSKVDSVNFKPHPFMIGPKHFGNMYIEPSKAPCEMGGCKLSFEDHTSDYVAFITLTRNCTNEEIREWLMSLTAENGWSTHYGHRPIDGFAFFETEFQIAAPVEENINKEEVKG